MHEDAVITIPFDEVALLQIKLAGNHWIENGYVDGEADIDADGNVVGLRIGNSEHTFNMVELVRGKYRAWEHDAIALVAESFSQKYYHVIAERLRQWRDGRSDRIGDQQHDAIKHG